MSSRNVFKEHKILELSVDNTDELDTWKASFLRAGVYPEREQAVEDTAVRGKRPLSLHLMNSRCLFKSAAEVGPIDPHMERQVETINKLVASYMQIIAKMTRDYIPKAIMFNIVQNVCHRDKPLESALLLLLLLSRFRNSSPKSFSLISTLYLIR